MKKRKRFQALPHSLAATPHLLSLFSFFFLLLHFSVPCLFIDVKAILALLKMTVMTSVSYFHVIHNRNTPSSKKKKKKRGWGEEGGKTECVDPQGFPLIG